MFSFKNQRNDVVSGSFSAQWSQYEYGSTTWGATPESRANRLKVELGVDDESLKNKLLIDAGCGAGDFHSYAERKYSVQIILVDISDSVEEAFNRNAFNQNCHYVQCDLANIPLRKKIFDYAYSNGVLHHMDRPLDGFKQLAGLLKEGGVMYVWLYHEYEGFDKLYLLSRLVCRMPREAQLAICKGLSLLISAKMNIANILRDKKTHIPLYRELIIMHMDALTPVYQSSHTQGELKEWLLSNGLIRSLWWKIL